ncbi:solute carrier organic anion transporter family member 3A1 [Caerostris darwini]|uniref:Solute carrier organic anion transporter family member n=1 Tax=Caerostris darwini TaxID=1538125 RepID=A0AAV4MG53_9ARAC|nr:solute carrier organic anion transporter family member 3A1 [Caerostris darwini]
MERWKIPQGITCKSCVRTVDEKPSLPSCCNMITPNGHGTPLKNPQNLTAGCNGNLIIKNGHTKSHLIKLRLSNGNSKNGPQMEKSGNHRLNLVKESLCCFKQQPEPSPKKHFEEAPEDKDGSCGIWSFKPEWLQMLANKKVFLAVFCLTSVLQGMYYTYFVSVLTTIEKLYQIQSKTTGLIMSATEIGQIGGALLLTYYGGQGHRPKWIACGMLVFGLAALFCAAPHFLYSDLTSPIRSTSDKENSSILALRELKSTLCHIQPPASGTQLLSLPLVSSNSTQEDFVSSFNSSTNETNLDQYLQPSLMYNRSHRSAHADDSRISSSNTGLSTPVVTPSKEALFSSKQDQCEERNKTGAHTRTTQTVLIIFFTSLLLIGIGATAVYTLGIPYIDDNVATRESPLYFGITIGVRIFGPVFGFLLGSFCTSIYVNFPFENTEITTDNPQWVGAWWLGVLFVGASLVLTAFPMMCFPKNLPKSPKACLHGTKEQKNLNHNGNKIVKCNGNAPHPPPPPQANGTDHNQCQTCQHNYYDHKEELNKPSLRDFPSAIRRLLKNEILLYRTASSVLHILPIAGLYTFLPKYLESQFHLTAAMANMVSGIAGILVMGIGIFASGSYMRKFKPNARFVARWIAASAALYAIGMIILMVFGCPLNRYVGLNAGSGYEDTTQMSCNATCSCKPGEFSPICTSEGVTYLSPCLAGCTQVYGSSYEEFTYKDCLCLGANVTATNGFCQLQCNNLLPYIFVFAIFVLVHSTSEVGSMLLTLRCVEPKDKAMALGLIAFAIGLFGNVPCPIIYGAVVDSACLFWEDNCGEQGACRLYDPSKFRGVFHGVTAVIMSLAFCVDLIVCKKAQSIQFQDEDEAIDVEETVPFNETSAQSESSV